jgi:hypothetical protein
VKIMTEAGLMDCVPIDPSGDQFKCHVCGAECPIAPQMPDRAVCAAHCEDHDYQRQGSDGKRCVHCFAEEPLDWK